MANWLANLATNNGMVWWTRDLETWVIAHARSRERVSQVPENMSQVLQAGNLGHCRALSLPIASEPHKLE